jgi:hypothetical protein
MRICLSESPVASRRKVTGSAELIRLWQTSGGAVWLEMLLFARSVAVAGGVAGFVWYWDVGIQDERVEVLRIELR